MKSSAGLIIALPFALALLGLVSLGALSYRNFADQRDNQQRVEQTLVVLDELEYLQSLLQYTLRGARGYLLTGNKEFLDLHDWAIVQLPSKLEAFRSLTVKNARQRGLRELAQFIESELGEEKKLVTRYRGGKMATVAEQRAVNDLKFIEDRLETAVLKKRRDEEKRLKEHQALVTSHARKVADLIVAFTSLAVLVVALAGMFLWRDFSARRRFEAALQESDARNRAILDTAQDSIITFDEKGVLESLNPATERIFGYAAAELIGKRYTSLMPEADRERVEGELAKYVESTAGLIVVGREEVGQRRDGSRLPFEYSLGETQFTNRRLFTVIVRDITRRKRIEQALRGYSERLAQSNRDLEDFAAVAAHDLQEPLRKIQNFGDRLLENCAELLNEQGRDYLRRMVDAAGRMQTLINDVLALSRVSAKLAPPTSVDLGKLADELVADLEVPLEQSGGRIEIGYLPTIEADAPQMRQLLQNLLSNALKYRRSEEPLVVMVASNYKSAAAPPPGEQTMTDEFCEISVRDNGIGFDEKYLDRIFDPFQRFHGHSQYGGSGMGLAICRRIVERHGGTITARSTPGQGSTFVVKLPMRQHLDKKSYGKAA